MEKITRGECGGSRASRGRSGQARDPGARRRRCWPAWSPVVRWPRDRFIEWCARLPAGCVVAMEASSSAHHWARKLVALGLDAADHLGAAGRALPQRGRERQERRQRRGGDLRGGFAPEDALRAGQVASSSRACCACTGCAKGSRKTAPPASTASAGCWPSSAWCSRKAPRRCSSCLSRRARGRRQRDGHAGAG